MTRCISMATAVWCFGTFMHLDRQGFDLMAMTCLIGAAINAGFAWRQP